VTVLPTASQKAEGSAFGSSTSTLGQFTLTAYAVGVEWDGSIEAFEDIPLFNATALRDISSAVQIFEEGKFLLGSGNGEPQGLVANVANGVAAAEADSNGNLLSIAATYDLLGSLRATYLPRASWLMQRATAIELRKAQASATPTLFEPVFTRGADGIERLHGFPISYSESMPTIAAGATPVVFGDFASAYLIGDRGGSAIRMKVLDQTKAAQGIVTLLVYRRTDGKVRRSEACQSLTLHS
jgi:HK97 family phage major capsid protein